jgi:tetratricopeptide (TPR) repeat protein
MKLRRVKHMDLSMLAALLEERRFSECRAAAEQLLSDTGLAEADRAQAFLALSCSLSGLHTVQAAIGPAELAVLLSRQSGDYDLMGRSLCHLAMLYQQSGLHQRAADCLADYFHSFGLYRRARGMEGWVLSHLGLFNEAMGQTSKALEYYRRALAWHTDQGAEPALVEQHRGDLAWLLLKAGRLGEAKPLLEQSAEYLRVAPNDLEARACHQNCLAYRDYLSGNHDAALSLGIQVIQMPAVSAARKAHAYLTLHYAARAMGRIREAVGLGTLARIQATVAGRPDLADEAVRSVLHIQQAGRLPQAEDLLESLRQPAAQNEG